MRWIWSSRDSFYHWFPPLDMQVHYSRDRQLDILRRDAPFSGAAEFVEGLPEEALTTCGPCRLGASLPCHSTPVEAYLHPSTACLVGEVTRPCGSAPVSAMSIAGTELPPYRTTSDPERLAAVERLLGPPPKAAMFTFTGLRCQVWSLPRLIPVINLMPATSTTSVPGCTPLHSPAKHWHGRFPEAG